MMESTNLSANAADAEAAFSDGEETVLEAPHSSPEANEAQLWQVAVYECCETALWRKQLVLTPHMLLDRLTVCAELLRDARKPNVCSDSRNQRVERAGEEIDHLLHLLWRSGLWTNTQTVEKTACDGQSYNVLTEPFTDGKPQGKPLSADAPAWLREVLGVD